MQKKMFILWRKFQAISLSSLLYAYYAYMYAKFNLKNKQLSWLKHNLFFESAENKFKKKKKNAMAQSNYFHATKY